MRKKIVNLVLLIFGILLGVALYPILPLGGSEIEPFQDANISDKSTSGENSFLIRQVEDILSVLKEDYYKQDSIDEAAMINRALHAYVDALGDPYTVYLDGSEYGYLVEDLQGEQKFAGIGAVIYKKDDGVMIEQVLKDSPAAKAELRPFDYIFEVDGESLAGLSIYDAVEKIRGEEGSIVTLSIIRENDDGTASVFERDVERGEIVNESVWTEVLNISGTTVLVLEITSIGEETDRILQEKIDELDIDTIDGIVLDLRGNAGGFLLEGVDIASHFLPRGDVVVHTEYPSYKDDVFRSKGYGSFVSKPLVVLVDGLTASASEIISLALRDQLGSTIVGVETFGKGTIQTLHEFAEGSLKYTVGVWTSPNGTALLTGGVVPDLEVTFNVTGFNENRIDSQLETAKELLLSEIK